MLHTRRTLIQDKFMKFVKRLSLTLVFNIRYATHVYDIVLTSLVRSNEWTSPVKALKQKEEILISLVEYMIQDPVAL